jgi:MFS family permease
MKSQVIMVDENTVITDKKSISYKSVIGLIMLSGGLIGLLTKHYLINDPHNKALFSFFSIISAVIGLLVIIPFGLIPEYIFDIQEWSPNETVEELVDRLRHRAILFSNLSVGILVLTIFVIGLSFYILVFTPDSISKPNELEKLITLRISATALVIFLVQILFRVFKYLLRVAAFYNGKADAIEFHKLEGGDLTPIMQMFTPDKYDINDISNPPLWNK